MNRGVLPPAFYDRPPEVVARELLGKRLVRCTAEGITTGRIVEAEAYLAEGDPACHACRGRTRKNAAMFGPPGRAYVYVIHARHCLNAVTQGVDVPSAVLIRAVEPLEGLPLMAQRRGSSKPRDLARGPARLCEAFAIDRTLNGWDLTIGERLWIDRVGCPSVAALRMATTPRIGVTSAFEMPLRFVVADSPYLSGPRRMTLPVSSAARQQGPQHR
jgi:DNA-3-methyladenine glycosylase